MNQVIELVSPSNKTLIIETLPTKTTQTTTSDSKEDHSTSLFWRIALISGCAVLGAFSREMLEILAQWMERNEHGDERLLTALGISFILPNAFGCFAMGFVKQVTEQLSKRDTSPRYPLILGITVGFCGCLTTFSTWIVSSISLLLQDGAISTSIGRLLFGIQIFSSSFLAGKHLGMINIPSRVGLSMLLIVFIFIVSVPSLIAAASIWRPSIEDLYIFLWAPLGALSRYSLGLLLNGPRRICRLGLPDGLLWFPLGTFTANILGVILLSPIFLQSSLFLEKFSSYFCGSLTTISSLVSELHSLDLLQSYIYSISTIFSATVLSLSILSLSILSLAEFA